MLYDGERRMTRWPFRSQRIGVSLNWYRRDTYDLRVTQNTLASLGDYSPIDIFNPLDGSTFTRVEKTLANADHPAALASLNLCDQRAAGDLVLGVPAKVLGAVGRADAIAAPRGHHNLPVSGDADLVTFLHADARVLEAPLGDVLTFDA